MFTCKLGDKYSHYFDTLRFLNQTIENLVFQSSK